MSGLCPKGSNCNFAHSIDELRARHAHLQRTFSERLGQGEEQKPPNYKICRKYYNGEICHYGVRCSFAHVEPGSLQDNNLVSNSKFSCWKTRLCHKWSTSGDCPYGDHCTYAHGDAELRKVRGDVVDLLVEKNVFVESPSKHTPDSVGHVLSKTTKTEFAITNSTLEFRKNIRDLTMRNSRIYGDWIDEVV
ncbi:Zinc finger CCCH domain-containing protein 12 [Platanthera zijinensis]|uniref:Zinc finger CCCH domain-containing protein 12 n=1 Tax=Platanthera zijinensis TaxID=2320716 RepID=A0AAP0AS78_9ASPA